MPLVCRQAPETRRRAHTWNANWSARDPASVTPSRWRGRIPGVGSARSASGYTTTRSTAESRWGTSSWRRSGGAVRPRPACPSQVRGRSRSWRSCGPSSSWSRRTPPRAELPSGQGMSARACCGRGNRSAARGETCTRTHSFGELADPPHGALWRCWLLRAYGRRRGYPRQFAVSDAAALVLIRPVKNVPAETHGPRNREISGTL